MFVIKAHRVALGLFAICVMGLLKAIKALAHPSKAYYNHVMCYTIRDYSVYAHTNSAPKCSRNTIIPLEEEGSNPLSYKGL